MIYTSNYESFKNSDLKTCSISGNKGKDVGYEGNYYSKLAPKRVFWQVWHDNIGKISEEENNKYYIEQYYELVLSKLDVEEVYRYLNYSILLCYEDSNIFCHRHIVAAWFELLLDVKVPEVKLIEGKIKKVERPSYIKDTLEEIMKNKIDMKGFNSLRALYIFEQANKEDSKADIILKSDDLCDKLAQGYRQYASYLRNKAEKVEQEYNKNNNSKKRIYQK